MLESGRRKKAGIHQKTKEAEIRKQQIDAEHQIELKKKK